jgi:hypothetical protein
MCHTARFTTGGSGENAPVIVSADSVRSVPGPVHATGRWQEDNNMTTEAPETTGRDGNAGTPQLYKLICIHNPGKKTGRRILRRSATVVVQTGEQPAGFNTCRPEMPADPQTMVSGLPEGFRKSGPEIPAETGYIMPKVPAGNEEIVAGSPAPDTPGGGAS